MFQDSCIPGAVFIWNVQNNSNEKKTISITFTFQNGIGDEGDNLPGCWSEVFSDNNVAGGLIHHYISDMKYTFGISAQEKVSSSFNFVIELL